MFLQSIGTLLFGGTYSTVLTFVILDRPTQLVSLHDDEDRSRYPSTLYCLLRDCWGVSLWKWTFYHIKAHLNLLQRHSLSRFLRRNNYYSHIGALLLTGGRRPAVFSIADEAPDGHKAIVLSCYEHILTNLVLSNLSTSELICLFYLPIKWQMVCCTYTCLDMTDNNSQFAVGYNGNY